MEKINIAELLKDCPKGMELDCTMYEDASFAGITENLNFPIRVKINVENVKGANWTKEITLTSEEKLGNHPNAKCVIFPKGKTTWEGFQRPFKDGDIVFYNDTVAIFKEWGDETLFRTHVTKYLCCDSLIDTKVPLFGKSIRKEIRLATEEEKQKLFDAIKANGYRWNAETKTLEKLPDPKFKVGNKVLWNYDTDTISTISKVEYTSNRGYVYWINCNGCSSGWWAENELTPVPNKFDITTLKPYDKVLYRMHDKDTWCNSFYSFYKNNHHFVTSLTIVRQCIPYKGNEHLLNTTNDCDDFYKTWEK